MRCLVLIFDKKFLNFYFLSTYILNKVINACHEDGESKRYLLFLEELFLKAINGLLLNGLLIDR